jgi:hypothetical protein
MSQVFKFLICLLLAYVAATAPQAIAGGVNVYPETVVVNGNSGDAISPGADLAITFDAHSFEYGSEEYAYLYFYMANKNLGDFKLTQRNLDRSRLFFIRWRSAKDSGDYAPTQLRLNLKAPDKVGRYTIRYSHVLSFRDSPLPGEAPDAERGYSGEVPDLARRLVSEELIRDGSWHGTLTTLDVAKSPPKGAKIDLYVRLNDKTPVSVDVKGGIHNKPLKLSWFPKTNSDLDLSKVRYRYKIWPENDEFGAWIEDSEIFIPFLSKGAHRISVQARYKDARTEILSKPASITFALDKPFLLKPLQKAVFVDDEQVQPRLDFDELYPTSRAILFGIHEFDDTVHFSTLPKESIDKDLAELKAALESNGFSDVIIVQKDRLSREEIMRAMEEFVEDTQTNDRLFIYFSTHGFADPNRKERGYIATSDCEYTRPATNCLPLDDLKERANDALEVRKARQVLVAVDSCFAGLGVITKAPVEVADLSQLGAMSGAFMITAGLADQKAEIDPRFGMSTFTHFLAKGLRGEAYGLDPNGLITLSELLVYVRYNVALATSSRQIPTMGLFLGGGEMLFKPTNTQAD